MWNDPVVEVWHYATLAAGATIVAWRLVRGAHSWAQVGAFGLGLLLAAIGVSGSGVWRTLDLGKVGSAALFALGWYAFGSRSSSSADPAGPDEVIMRTTWPKEQDRRAGRIQAAMLLYFVAQAVVVPILWVTGHLPGWLIGLFVVVSVFVVVGGAYATYRLVPRSENPFERRGKGFLAWWWTILKRMAIITGGRLPLVASPHAGSDGGRH